MKFSAPFSRVLSAVVAWLALGATLAHAQVSLPAARVGEAYTFQVTTNPAAPAGTVYAATGLPTGVSINASSGAISGTPTTAGTASGTISLTSGGATNSFAYTLLVNPPTGTPAITSATTANATVGGAFTYTVTASNSPTSFNVGLLPDGLTFTSPDITGTPTAAGTYEIALSANNAAGLGATTTLTLTVAPAGPVPTITSATTASATAVTPATEPASYTVNYQIAASNSPASFAASGLPFGVSVDSVAGLISGTTTATGIYTVALTATNNNGTSAVTNLTLTVGDVSAVTSAATLSITAGQAMTPFALAGSHSPVSFNVNGLPAGLAVSAAGVITGTPTTAGTYPVTVSANNAVGTGPSSTLTIAVAAPAGGGGGGGGGTPGPAITSANVAAAIAGVPFTFTVQTSPAATSYTATGLPSGVTIHSASGAITGTFATVGTYTVTITATNAGGSAVQTLTITVNSRPSFTSQPQSTSGAAGATVALMAAGTGSPAPTYQWFKDGTAIAGATGPSLTLADLAVADAGAYTVVLTNVAGTATSQTAVVGVISSAKVAGDGEVVQEDIVHPNGNIYDQVLLTGASAAITADANQITRISFVDLNDDIVQVEMSGGGTLTVTLENPSAPAAPVKYNQPDIQYAKGHASLVITGADASTNVTVFSVGTLTAINQTLFKAGETYDGVADIGSISIASTDGKFDGIRTGNAAYFRAAGLTGIYAPGVAVSGPTYIGEVTADTEATPVLVFGSTTDMRINGGDLTQLNERAIQTDGVTRVEFRAGASSNGVAQSAGSNQARWEKAGEDITDQIEFVTVD